MAEGPDRRTVLAGGAAAALAMAAASPASAAGGAAPSSVRAVVLENRDQWTQATGAAELLRRAGVEVVDLDLSRAPADQGGRVDLVVFGGFTNNVASYGEYVGRYGQQLRDLVAGGGVVLDMTQSDQLGAAVSYLPEGMSAVRADPDHRQAYPSAPEHPLVGPLPVAGGQVLTGRTTAFPLSYETLRSWRRMRVLLAVTRGGVPPCLLEGQHGKGRFLVTSLTLDKCFGPGGAPVQPEAAVRDSAAFFAALAGYVSAVRAGTAADVVPTPVPPEAPAGPMVGHVDARNARIWARPGLDPDVHPAWVCVATPLGRRGAPVTVRADISRDNDDTVVFDLRNRLRPATRYTVEVTPRTPVPGFAPLTGSFTTDTRDGEASKVVMGLGSCAPDGPSSVWTRVMTEGCESFVMLGDTPYIDSGDLTVARTKHRDFLRVPELAELVSSMPVWATWDDHDFGGNDIDGTFAGKRNTRTAFVDYRANATFGHDARGREITGRTDGEGLYTSFRRGPVEVFLIDPRWFSGTAPSFADPSKPTCIGQTQWEWLQRQLLASTATFKVLATGMIWDDKQNPESDDWGFYAHERDAIFDFIRAERIPGCLLLGGDIHVSRALNYGPRVGYDLWQYIVSPLHDRTIPSLNVPNPALVHSAVEPHVFLKLVADSTTAPATLTATWINREGRRIFEVATDADQLTPREAYAQVETTDLPQLIPGQTSMITTSFTNNATGPLTGVSAELELPPGWTAQASTPATFETVPAGQGVPTTWEVTPPVDATAGQARLTVHVDYRSGTRTARVSATATAEGLAAGTIRPSQLSVAAVSSEDAPHDAAANAVDGNPATFWHTRWSTSPVPVFPHWIAIDLGATYELDAMGYLTRQDAPNGRIKDYEVFVSADGQSWGEPVATGSFTGTDLVQVPLTGSRGRYLKLVGLNAQNGAGFAGAAEITAYGRRL